MDIEYRAGMALVTAAMTDAWDEVRGRVALIFGRGQPDARIERLLDETGQDLVAASESQCEKAARKWAELFADLLVSYPDAKPELAALVALVDEIVPGPPPTALRHLLDRPTPAASCIPQASSAPAADPVPADSSPDPGDQERDLDATGAWIMPPPAAALPQFDYENSQTDVGLRADRSAPSGAPADAQIHPPVAAGMHCRNGHLIDLEALFCPICGISMNQQTLVPVPMTGSLTEVPDDVAVSRAVQAAVKPGLLAFNPPAEMTQGRKERIEVRVARSPELREALVKGLRGAVQFEEVPTADYMGVELTGDSFKITPFSPLEQIVAPKARWEFDVTPLRSGIQTLTLVVSLGIKHLAPAVNGRIGVPVLQRQIRIRVNIGYGTRGFLARNWQWLVGTAVAVVAALGAWAAFFR